MIALLPPGHTYENCFTFSEHDRDGFTAEDLSKLSADQYEYFFREETKAGKCDSCSSTETDLRVLVLKLKDPVNRSFVAALCDDCRIVESVCGLCLRIVSKASLKAWKGRFACIPCLLKLGELENDN